jgi:hypothetical protein
MKENIQKNIPKIYIPINCTEVIIIRKTKADVRDQT